MMLVLLSCKFNLRNKFLKSQKHLLNQISLKIKDIASKIVYYYLLYYIHTLYCNSLLYYYCTFRQRIKLRYIKFTIFYPHFLKY